MKAREKIQWELSPKVGVAVYITREGEKEKSFSSESKHG